MRENPSNIEALKKKLLLKQPEPDLSPGDPWGDDALDRSRVADALTNLVQDQSAPLVIGLNGDWGTGKTFFLKRWREQLEQADFQAIYFNAWEDDFCDDPLVAIIGQLSDFLKEEGLKELAGKIKRVAGTLLIQNIRSLLSHHTRITIPDDQSLKNFVDRTFDEYAYQREKKDELKKLLEELSKKIKGNTTKPLVFIIDELDRCRPTFAIELLERVKHIFDVPNMVFVFGINRTELCKSVCSIYGEIEADVYLRRFFDMEFLLPEANPKTFFTYLAERYKLQDFFSELSRIANVRSHREGFQKFAEFFPYLYSCIGLSLRDIDYCARAMALAGKNINERRYMYPYLLGVLIVLRLKNHPLYRKFVQGECIGAEVMDYIDELVLNEPGNQFDDTFKEIEAELYLTELHLTVLNRFQSDGPRQQLELLAEGSQLTHPKYLSKKTQKAGKERAKDLLQWMDFLSNNNTHRYRYTIQYLSGLIELTEIPRDKQQI